MADAKIALRIVLITTSHWSWTKGKEFRRATGWPLRSLDRNQTWWAAPLIGLHELRPLAGAMAMPPCGKLANARPILRSVQFAAIPGPEKTIVSLNPNGCS